MIRRIRSVALVCLRWGIIAPRWVPPVSRGSGGGSLAVGAHKAGMISLLPGTVRYVCPDGDVQITVPSGNHVSRQVFAVLSSVVMSAA